MIIRCKSKNEHNVLLTVRTMKLRNITTWKLLIQVHSVKPLMQCKKLTQSKEWCEKSSKLNHLFNLRAWRNLWANIEHWLTDSYRQHEYVRLKRRRIVLQTSGFLTCLYSDVSYTCALTTACRLSMSVINSLLVIPLEDPPLV